MEISTLQKRYGISSVKEPFRRLGSLAGVPVYGAADWKRIPVALLVTGIGLAQLTERRKPLLRRIISGFGYSGIMAGSVATHKLGHIAAGRVIGKPMDGVVLTFPAPLELYAERGTALSLQQHRIRAAGGPLANLIVGFAANRIAQRTGWCFVRATGRIHLAHTAASLAPVLGLDGDVLFRGRADGVEHWETAE